LIRVGLPRVAAVATLALVATLLASPIAVADPPFGSVGASGHDQQFDFNRYLGGESVEDPGSAVDGLPTKRYQRKPAIFCHDDDIGDLDGCAWLIEKVAKADCPKDSLPLDPLYMSTRTVKNGKAGEWSQKWTYVADSALCLRERL